MCYLSKYLVFLIRRGFLLKHQRQLLNPALSLCEYSPLSIPQDRMMCKHVDVVDHTCKVSNYNDYLFNYNPIIWILTNTLVEILGISKLEIKKILNKNPQLKKRSRANILNNYYNLIEAGIQIDTIKNNVWLLAYENNKLLDKLNCIKVLNMDNNQLIPWLHLTQVELANYVYYTQQDTDSYMFNRMEYLSHKLECSIKQLCEITVLNSFLMKISLSSVDKKLNILFEYNVNNTDILKNVWVLRYSENHIRHICELYKDTGRLNIKTIRCPLKIISRAIQKNQVELSLMQHYGNISEYLQNKLKINEEKLNTIITKVPDILRMNIAKLDQLINILQANKITSEEILWNAQILSFNVENIRKRIQILKKEGLIPNIIILSQSEHMFNRYIEMNARRQEILQEYGNIKNYLIKKLDVDEELIEKIITKYPSILRINIIKLSGVIDILRQNGFTGDEIIRSHSILYFKPETIYKRIEMLKESGITPRIILLISIKKI
ncbi:transcription termination factor, mitochondrial isoform X1 [Pogonomyrmex barbatus]|uniref:Transcription termination factor, mitochondrial isoform X1 n=2 Tax=Pogonomyrmex barbatus TaxID=144034 RepID=A0A6I9WSP3_9HYME|nr:transcription termination factor, mitochondrial isoform X1 [Pogonomyrmex barbatus]